MVHEHDDHSVCKGIMFTTARPCGPSPGWDIPETGGHSDLSLQALGPDEQLVVGEGTDHASLG